MLCFEPVASSFATLAHGAVAPAAGAANIIAHRVRAVAAHTCATGGDARRAPDRRDRGARDRLGGALPHLRGGRRAGARLLRAGRRRAGRAAVGGPHLRLLADGGDRAGHLPAAFERRPPPLRPRRLQLRGLPAAALLPARGPGLRDPVQLPRQGHRGAAAGRRAAARGGRAARAARTRALARAPLGAPRRGARGAAVARDHRAHGHRLQRRARAADHAGSTCSRVWHATARRSPAAAARRRGAARPVPADGDDADLPRAAPGAAGGGGGPRARLARGRSPGPPPAR